jgi:hypothetical protein
VAAMRLSRGTKNVVLITACWVLLAQDGNAQDCKGLVKSARAGIGQHVEAMRRYEHEASDRLKGLDSRPFEFLLAEARKTAAVIADPAALELEKSLERCRNGTAPVRKICAGAAQALVDVLEKHVADPKPDYDRPGFAGAVAACERLMDLKPLASAIRGTE